MTEIEALENAMNAVGCELEECYDPLRLDELLETMQALTAMLDKLEKENG